MSHNLLDDDIDWNDDDDEFADNTEGSNAQAEAVVTLQNFNSEQQAQIAAAALRAQGIAAQVVAASTGQLTPFAYGNVRLFVAESQAAEAREILKLTDARRQVLDNPRLSAARILLIVIVALFALTFASRLVSALFSKF